MADVVGYIVVLKDGARKGSMELPSDQSVIFGRDKGVDVRIRLATVSRIAARIVAEDGKAFFINDSTTNPVLLNGTAAPIGVPVCLVHGATFSFDDRTFCFEYEGAFQGQDFDNATMKSPPPVNMLPACNEATLVSANNKTVTVLAESKSAGNAFSVAATAVKPQAEAPRLHHPVLEQTTIVGHASVLQPTASNVTAPVADAKASSGSGMLVQDENMQPMDVEPAPAPAPPVSPAPPATAPPAPVASAAKPRAGTPTITSQFAASGSPLAAASPEPLRPVPVSVLREAMATRTPAKSALKKPRPQGEQGAQGGADGNGSAVSFFSGVGGMG